MPRNAQGSKRFRDLVARLEQLRLHLLSFIPAPPAFQIGYSDQQIDSTRAYIVLAHAEIEAFCEDRVLERARNANMHYSNSGMIEPLLRRLAIYFLHKNHGLTRNLWIDLSSAPPSLFDSAFQSYKSAVHANNGIKRVNLEKLLFPIGILESDLSPGWLAQMDSFGTDRGDVAHQSARAQQALDPLTQLKTVGTLVSGLLDFDRKISRIR